MEKLLEGHKLPELTLEEIDNLNGAISVKELKIEFTVKISHKENPRPDGITSEFYQTFEEIKISILHKLFQKILD